MAIYLNAITDTGTDKNKVQLSSNTWRNERFDMIKDSEVFYQWCTDRINMSIPMQIFINDKSQVIDNFSPIYCHVVRSNAIKIVWHRFIFRME